MSKIHTTGDIIGGRYHILSILGSGGSGCVYLVVDEKTAVKRAVKHIPLIGAGGEAAEEADLFSREVEILAGLKHPAIPDVHGFFSTPDGHYLVMDFIEGHSLKTEQEKRGKPLSEGEVTDLALQICEVLEYLHENPGGSLLFRDLKPSNIMLTPEGKIILIDFGLAKKLQPEKGGSTIHLGTVGYAPPEQYEKVGVLGPESDLYSLGVTMFQLLTGVDPTQRPPFDFMPPRLVNRKISRGMNSVVNQLLAHGQTERFQSSRELKNVLGKIRQNPNLTISQVYSEKPEPVKVRWSYLPFLLILLILVLAGYLFHRYNKMRPGAVSPPVNEQSALLNPYRHEDDKGHVFTAYKFGSIVKEEEGNPNKLLIEPLQKYYLDVKNSLQIITTTGEDVVSTPAINGTSGHYDYFGDQEKSFEDSFLRGSSTFISDTGTAPAAYPWESQDLFEGQPGQEILLPDSAFRTMFPDLYSDLGPSKSKGRLLIGDNRVFWLISGQNVLRFGHNSVGTYGRLQNNQMRYGIHIINDFVFDRKGDLWLGGWNETDYYYKSSVAFLRYKYNKVEFVMLEGQSNWFPLGLFTDKTGKIWFTQSGRKLTAMTQEIFKVDEPPQSNGVVAGIAPDGSIWAFNQDGLLFQGKESSGGIIDWRKETELPDEIGISEEEKQNFITKIPFYDEYDTLLFTKLPLVFQYKLYISADGTVWVSRLGNLYSYSNGSWSKIIFPEVLSKWMEKDRLIDLIQVDQYGNLWLRVTVGSRTYSTYSYTYEAVLVRGHGGWFVLF